MNVSNATIARNIAKNALKEGRSLSNSERADSNCSHLSEILDQVSIYGKDKVDRQVATTILGASRAAPSDEARCWVSYQGLKHIAGGLQGPTAVALCSIGSEMMDSERLSDTEAATCGAALIDGVAAYSPGILETAKVKGAKEAAMRMPDASTQKNVLLAFFQEKGNSAH